MQNLFSMWRKPQNIKILVNGKKLILVEKYQNGKNNQKGKRMVKDGEY